MSLASPIVSVPSTEVFGQLGIALGIGLLIGLQRQRTDSVMAGVRTFPLVAVLGVVMAHLSFTFGGWVFALGLFALFGLTAVANLGLTSEEVPIDPGLTTEIALFLTYAIGGYLVVGEASIAVAVGGGTAVLLQFKEPLHRVARRIGDSDFRSLIQFVVITLVILPVLPDKSFGPHQVLNLREIWWMVVLIVGIGMAGYLAYRIFGSGAGKVLAGILGGLISSTATTVSYSRYARRVPEALGMTSAVILIASAVVLVRVLVEVAVVAPRALYEVGLPVTILLLGMILLAAIEGRRKEDHLAEEMSHGNPSELRSALLFAALYALILVAVASVKDTFHEQALYGVALLSGLTDMDAITLSTGKLMQANQLAISTGWRLILVAALANMAFKLGIVGLLGGRRLFNRLVRSFLVAFAIGFGLLLFWPG